MHGIDARVVGYAETIVGWCYIAFALAALDNCSPGTRSAPARSFRFLLRTLVAARPGAARGTGSLGAFHLEAAPLPK
jgi:hypothetical protein